MNSSLYNGTKSSTESRLLNSEGRVLNHSLKTTKPQRRRGLPQDQVVWEDGGGGGRGANALKGVEGAADYGSARVGVNKLRCPFPGRERWRAAEPELARGRSRGKSEGFFVHWKASASNTQDAQGHFNSHTAAQHQRVNWCSECKRTYRLISSQGSIQFYAKLTRFT